jgi:hypothetical protein
MMNSDKGFLNIADKCGEQFQELSELSFLEASRLPRKLGMSWQTFGKIRPDTDSARGGISCMANQKGQRTKTFKPLIGELPKLLHF